MCPRGSCPGTAFSGPMSRFRRFSVCVSCPRCWSSFCCNFPGFRGLAEVVLEASCRLKPARGFPPRVAWRKSRDVFSDTYIWSVLLAWGSRPGGDADGSSRSYKLVVAENWKGQSCEAVRSEKPSYSNRARKWWFWKRHFCWFGCIALMGHLVLKKLRRAHSHDGMGMIQLELEWCPVVLLIFFLFWCSLFKWQMWLTESFRNRGSLRKRSCLLGANVSTCKQWKLWYF